MRRQSSYSVCNSSTSEVEDDVLSTMQRGQFRKLGLPRRFSAPEGFKEEEETIEARHQIQADQFVTKQYLEKKGRQMT